MRRFYFSLFLSAGFIIICQTLAIASDLKIINSTSSEVLNIYVRPLDNNQRNPFFLRLDLSPMNSDIVENPDLNADIRVDTGLQFWSFKNVSLKNVSELILHNDSEVFLVTKSATGLEDRYAGVVQELVPQKGEKPVCELSRFHPAMKMEDVCKILDDNTPIDDNGAIITGLGFGGKLWAGRLMPDQPGPANNDSILEHMELRRHFDWNDVNSIIQFLQKEGYVPWQAEFPNSDVDFADMPLKREQTLQTALNNFINSISNKNAPQEVATIILAPATSLDALANADNPERDIQLFTLILKPKSGLTILDVAAYRGE